MMTLNNILVEMDPMTDTQPALRRAIQLAKTSGASLELFLAVSEGSIVSNWFVSEQQQDQAKENFIASNRRWLKTYFDEVNNLGLTVTMDVVWHRPYYRAVLKKLKTKHFDLVIKSTRPHPAISRIFFTPNDWQLLKSCPSPLLLVKDNHQQPYKKLMACVDPTHREGEHKGLNSAILNLSAELSQGLKLNTQIFHSCEPMGLEIWQAMPEMGGISPSDHQIYIDNLLERHTMLLNELVNDFTFKNAKIDIKIGDPVSAICREVEETQTDLVIMGTTYHTGLIGTTAEKILDEVNCDILAVKSDFFQPV